VFKKQVEEKSGGTITVDVYHDGLLGDEAALWQSVRDGSVDMVVVGSYMNQEFPMMLISDWPFLYRDLEHAKKVWTGSIADEVSAKFNERFPEVELLGWAPNSARTFTSNKKLTSVEDFVGQKFRMPNNPIHVGIAENLGASSQVIPLGELFSALETGVVDGQDNGMVTVIAQNLQEVQKYLYETNHIIATLEIIVNSDKLDEMSENQRQIIRDAAKAAAEQSWNDYIASVDSDRQTLIDAGVTVTQLTPEDQAKIIEKIQPTIDKLLAENDWAAELTEKIKAVQ
jgi:tripartite ATP-independent transporter DctP family solute receptor